MLYNSPTKKTEIVDFPGMCLGGFGKAWGTLLKDVWAGLGHMFRILFMKVWNVFEKVVRGAKEAGNLCKTSDAVLAH